MGLFPSPDLAIFATATAGQGHDLTPIIVAVVGAVATVIAAMLAMRQRSTDVGENVPEVIEQWHQIVDAIKDERDRAVRERDVAIKQAEDAIAARDQALLELRACRHHDHGSVT